MKILVTGSSGFIARSLIPALAAKGHSIVGIDKRFGQEFGDYFHFVHGNILDDAAVDAAMGKVELIVHLAAEHKDFGIQEDLYYQVNVEGTANLLAHASKHGVQDFIFYSSVAVYGERRVPTNEGLDTTPESHYGRSKLFAENRIETWVNGERGRRAVIVRPTVVFGPHNFANMYRLIDSIAKRRFLAVGSGGNIKSVAYVENLTAATLFLMDRLEPGMAVFNYADSPHLTTRELVERISESLGNRLPAIRVPLWLAYACALPFDFLARVTKRDLPLTAKRIGKFTSPTHHEAEKIRRAGFSPPLSIEDGIQDTIEWYRHGQSSLPPHELGTDAT